MGTLIWVSIVAGLWVLWFVVSWSVLLMEKRRPLKLTPMAGDDARLSDAYVVKMRKEAEDAGFVWVGAYAADSGVLGGFLAAMLPPDGGTLLLIVRSKMLRKIALESAMTDDVWVVTMSTVGDPDCSGLSAEEAVPTSTALGPVLARHRERLAGREQEIIPWSPEEIIKDLEERDRAKVRRLMETGMVRVRDGMTGRWSFTVKGASRQRAAMRVFFKKAMEAAKAEQEEKKRAKTLGKR